MALAAAEGKRGSARSPQKALVDAAEREFPLKNAFVALNGGMCRALGRRLCNGRIRFVNGMVGDTFESPGKLGMSAQREFASVLASRGVPFLLALAPCKLDLDGSLFPEGWRGADLNAIARNELGRFADSGARTLDMTVELAGTADRVGRNYFATDHHWRYRAAMRAARLVADEVSDMAGVPGLAGHPNLDPENWEWTVLRKSFVGTAARRTGPLFVSPDDFEYCVPKFATELVRSLPFEKKSVTGGFEKVEMEMKYLRDAKRPKAHRYRLLTGAPETGRGLQVHENARAAAPLKLMLVRDSYGNPVGAFLATVFAEVIQTDYRYLPDGVSLSDVVDRYRPDVVVWLSNSEEMLTAGAALGEETDGED